MIADWLIALICVVVYAIMWGVTAGLAHRVDDGTYYDFDICVGMVWPIGILMVLGIAIYKWIGGIK